MFARAITFNGARDLDAGISFVREHALPVLRQQEGFQAVNASIDRSQGLLGVLSLWATAEARDASESALGKVREDGLDVIGGGLTIETFEELYVEVVSPPAVGMPLLLRRVSLDPSTIEEKLEFFRTTVVAELKASPGFCAVRNMGNRETGQGMIGTVWADQSALRAAAAMAEERRARAAAQGVTFGEQSQREIVLMELA